MVGNIYTGSGSSKSTFERTPIADAFAYGRAVDPAAMALIRKLEMDRAALRECALTLAEPHPEEAASIAAEYPLDKV